MEFKVSVIGDGGVGKSTIIIQLIGNHFIEDYDPTIEDSYRKQITVDGELCLLDIYDYAGADDYSAMRDHYFAHSVGFLLVYSITNRTSFEVLNDFRIQILRKKNVEKFPMVLVGNKCDLEHERTVMKQEGEELAKKWGIPFLETSARTRINIEEIFFQIKREASAYEYAMIGSKTKPIIFVGDPFVIQNIMKYWTRKNVVGYSSNRVANCVRIVGREKKAKQRFAFVFTPDSPSYFNSEEKKMERDGVVYLCFNFTSRKSFDTLMSTWTSLCDTLWSESPKYLIGMNIESRDRIMKKNRKNSEIKKFEYEESDHLSRLPDGIFSSFGNEMAVELLLSIFQFLPSLKSVRSTSKKFSSICTRFPPFRFLSIDEPVISKEEGERLSKKLKCLTYIECSVITGKGMEKLDFVDIYKKHVEIKKKKLFGIF